MVVEASLKSDNLKETSRRRPWRRGVKENDILVNRSGIQSSSEALTASQPDDLIFKNQHQSTAGNSSSDGLARSSSVFVDTEDDGYQNSAISQLLVQITDLLANSPNDDLALELRFSPSARQTLENELRQLTEEEQTRQLPMLSRILQLSPSNSSILTNKQELLMLEGEIFAYLDNHKEDLQLDPFLTLQRCLATKRVRPPYNRFLQLHLRSFLQHPVVQETEDLKLHLQDFVQRLERSPDGIDLTNDDANFLLELITITNTSIFSPISTPPSIFNQRSTGLIQAAMRIAQLSVDLQRLAERGEIITETQKNLLEETQNLLTASENQSCQSARFFSRIIPKGDRIELSHVLEELLNACKDVKSYQIPRRLAKELSLLSIRLGEVGLTCAKFKIAKAHHIVRNRFRFSSKDFQRVCIIDKSHHQVIRDALLLINAAAIVKYQDIEPLINVLNGEALIELGKEDATCLEHLLTTGLDFQSSIINRWNSTDETSNIEEIILPVHSSVVRNPFALSKTPEPDDRVDTMINEFFQNKDENTYENDSLLKPIGVTSSLNREDFNSSHSDLIIRGSLRHNDAQCCFKLLVEMLTLRKFLAGIQRTPTQLFAYKLAPFQIIQLCDCVRKLTSVKPEAEDAKLIDKLSTEANRHMKFKLKTKTVNSLRGFYQRIHDPILQSCSKRMNEEYGDRPIDEAKDVYLNAEKTFNQAEICSALLFDTIDSLSLLFLDSIKQRCVNNSTNSVTLSMTEYENFCLLSQEANVNLKAIQGQPIPSEVIIDKAAQLLYLYKIRTLLKIEENLEPSGLSKRLLWKHALTQFFNCYSDKAMKSPFTDGAFSIFIEESDHLPEDIQQGILQEIQHLIDSSERATNTPSDAVNNLLASKLKRSKLLEALKCKFIVSLMNNRQLNCDASSVGQWITSLEWNNSLNHISAEAEEGIRQFLLTQPETQELNEAALTEYMNFSNVDQTLAIFEPIELIRIISLTSGIGQISTKSALLYVLLLEILIKHVNQSKIYIHPSILSELQGRPLETRIDTTEFERNIDSFIRSDNSQLYSLASLRSLHSTIDNPDTATTNTTDNNEVLFVLSMCLNYLPVNSELYQIVKNEVENLRNGSVNHVSNEIRPQMIGQLQHSLEEKLTNDIHLAINECICHLSNPGCINDRDLLSTLQFICLSLALLPIDVEIKLLTVLLSRPVGSLTVENLPLIRSILADISIKLLASKDSSNRRNLRLLIPLLPTGVDTDDDQANIEFDKLLTTICIANELAFDMGSVLNSKLNHLLAEMFWSVFFNHEQLTSNSVFGRLYEETAALTYDWMKADSQQMTSFFSKLFYTNGRFPLGQIRHGKLTPDVNTESYFHLFQSLLVIIALLKYTNSRVILTREHMFTLYHAILISINSTHFHRRQDAKIGLIYYLNQIEKAHNAKDGEQVSLSRLLFNNSIIQRMMESMIIETGRRIVETFRSHIAPIILPLGSDIGDPFMSPDLDLIREGLETSLCGYFSINPTDALSALRLINQLQHNDLTNVDLAITCQIINHLFKDGMERFQGPNRQQNNSCIIDITDDLVHSAAIETAISNLDAFSSRGSLTSTQDIEIFLKSIFTLSLYIGSTNSTETVISETIVSSPSETMSSFSVRQGSGTEAFQSLDSSPMFPKISKESSPEEDETLVFPVQIDVRKLVEKMERSSEDQTLCDLLDCYHYSRLLLQSQKSIKSSIEGLVRLIPDLECILPSFEQVLTVLQTKFLLDISHECLNRIKTIFKEVMLKKEMDLTIKLLHGYFSLMLPTSTTTPVAAYRLMALRIAQIHSSLTSNQLWTYVENHLTLDSTNPTIETTILAIQGVQKVLDGFTLNIVEQICLFYALHQEADVVLFADLAASINWLEIWPSGLMPNQREYLSNTLIQWNKLIIQSNSPAQVKSLNFHQAYPRIAVGMSTNWSVVEGLDVINAFSVDPRIHSLRESLEPTNQMFDNVVASLKTQLSLNTLDGFTNLTNTDAFSIISSIRRIKTSTDWFDSIGESVNQSCQRLYLAIACNLIFNDSETKIQLPRKYLRFQEILSILLTNHQIINTTPTPIVPLARFKTRPKGVHSMETLTGSLSSLLDLSGYSTPFKRNSLNKLHELIEIRRAVVAGSRCELNQPCYNFSRVENEEDEKKSGQKYPRVPDKLDLSILRRQCKEHTRGLLQRATYEQRQTELYCRLLNHNLQLTLQKS